MRNLSLALLLGLSAFTQTRAEEVDSARFFRDIFHSELQKVSPELRTEDFIFLPTSEVTRVPRTLDRQDPLKSISRSYGSITPSQLYENGLREAPRTIEGVDEIFKKSGPVTIVVVPGIYGEFFNTRPFDEVMSKGGTFKQRWTSALAKHRDSVFSLAELEQRDIGLDEVVDLASIDDANGNSLVNVIFLKPLFGSLETLGSADKVNAIYMRRLDKVFAELPIVETSNVYLLGYSRGAPYALDLIVKSRARVSAHPWAARVRGHIGLVGVYYGSESADDAIGSQSAGGEAASLLRQLAQDLEISEGSLGAVFRNNERWRKSIGKIVALAPELAKLLSTDAIPDLLQLGLPKPDLGSLTNTFSQIAFSLLKLNDPVADYDNNIRRFKILVEDLLEGAEPLTVESRLAWWRKNTLPADIALYDVVGTMPDVIKQAEGNEVLAALPGYGIDSVDYFAALRTGFYGMTKLSGTQLNDSQMSVARAHYWPEAAQILNPKQAPLKSHLMAVMGTHHWGCSYPIVFPRNDGTINEFPRSVLLKSIATFIAYKQAE